MLDTTALPIGVKPRVCEYLELLKREDASFVQDVYLVGSIALGDYQEGRSDIDFVALVANPLSAPQIESLARIHAAIAASEGPHFDGFYIGQAELRRVPAPKRAPFSVDGIFRSDAVCFEINPVTWLCLAQHGITVRGRPAQALAIATDPASLQSFETDNLRTYWEPWIEEGGRALARKAPGEDADATVLAWGVLGLLRIAYTLTTGRIISKAEAGRWGLTKYRLDWHPVIQDALSARFGHVNRLPVFRCRRAVEFMRYVIADALAAASR
jgi:hypothetical protein